MSETAASKKKLKIFVDNNLEERVKKKISVEAPITGKNERGKINFAELRSGGFIKQRQKDKFTVRLKCPGGRMSIDKLKAAVKVAEEYGKGFVHFTVRQSLEIPYVDYHDFGPVVEKLKGAGQEIASCGPRVRVPNACGGCEYNPNGITDAVKMANTVDEKFFGIRTPHKFKTSFSSCPIDCMRTVEADLGCMGAVFPKWSEETCTGCTICSSACAEGAIESHAETGKPIFDADKCLYCSDCIRACPTQSWTAEKTGHNLLVGGFHGRHPQYGTTFARFLTDDEAIRATEATINWYNEAGEGKGRVRIGKLLREEGNIDSYMKALEAAIGPEKLVKDPLPPEPLTIRR